MNDVPSRGASRQAPALLAPGAVLPGSLGGRAANRPCYKLRRGRRRRRRSDQPAAASPQRLRASVTDRVGRRGTQSRRPKRTPDRAMVSPACIGMRTDLCESWVDELRKRRFVYLSRRCRNERTGQSTRCTAPDSRNNTLLSPPPIPLSFLLQLPPSGLGRSTMS